MTRNSRKILVLTTEPLPLPGQATTGAGLRAWGLAHGLRSAGISTIVATCFPSQRHVIESLTTSEVRFFDRTAVIDIINSERPAAVLLQHWGLAADVPELSIPLAIDLAGPHLLERMYWGGSNIDADLGEKVSALRRADFVTCSGEFQRHYFYPFLAMAGYDLRSETIPVIPFSVPPPSEPAQIHWPHPDEPIFIYGGAFLAWQDPSRTLNWLLAEMDSWKRGQLRFYGGAHPGPDASGGKFAELSRILKSHPRVQMRGTIPFETLVEEYRTGTVAIDLMERNPERELALTTRTMVYLYCGLPVIHDNYSELSGIIERYDCGWTLSPSDEAGFRSLVRKILSGEQDPSKYHDNTIAAASHFSWDRTIAPLTGFCSHPAIRSGKITGILSIESARHERELLRCRRDEALSALHSLEGKLIVKFARRIPRFSFLLAPFAWVAGWVFAAILWSKFKTTTRKI